MRFTQRVSTAISVLRNKGFGDFGQNATTGAVLRNYGKQSHFRPQEQVRGITYKAIDKIGQSLSVYEPYVKDKAGKVYENHPLLALFNKPNPRMTASDFVHLYGMLYEIYGETFWYLARGMTANGLTSGKVKEVYLLNPAQMEVCIHEGELVGYVLHKTNGDRVPFEPTEIIHDKRPNPFNEWRGMSVLERAATYVDIELVTSEFTLNYMRNNASPSGIVSLPSMTPEAFTMFTQQWRENYEGPQNAGKTAFIRNGQADFKAVGATLKDVDQKITREMAKDDVLMMLDMPKPLLGMTDGNGFGRGNVETLKYIFAESKLEPMMKRLDRIYSTILLGNEANEGRLEIDHESPVPEDKEFELKRSQAGVNVWLTVNEVRAEQGLPPIDGGDVLDTSNTAVQQEQTGKTIKKVVLAKPDSKAEVEKKLNKKQEKFRKRLIETNDIYAVKIKSAIANFVEKQGKVVIANINATKKAYEEWLPNVKDTSTEMASIITPIILELMEAQGEDVANFITGELLTITPEIRKKVEADILKISGVYNAETITKLEETIGTAVTNGESLIKIKARVEQVYADAAGFRAERIARTESLRASNDTAEQVYFQNGYSYVQWFVNPNACEFCSTFSGQTKAIGSSFMKVGDVLTAENGKQMEIDYSDIDTPPLHPNCTCSIIPVNGL